MISSTWLRAEQLSLFEAYQLHLLSRIFGMVEAWVSIYLSGRNLTHQIPANHARAVNLVLGLMLRLMASIGRSNPELEMLSANAFALCVWGIERACTPSLQWAT